MATVATLIGGLAGLFAFWVAWFGFGHSFWTSFGIYLFTGTLTTLLLVSRAMARGVFDEENGDEPAGSGPRLRAPGWPCEARGHPNWAEQNHGVARRTRKTIA